MSKYTLVTLKNKIKTDLYGGEDYQDILDSLDLYIRDRAENARSIQMEMQIAAGTIEDLRDKLKRSLIHIRDVLSPGNDESDRLAASKWLESMQQYL